MAEAFCNQMAKGKVRAFSAGTRPSNEIDSGVAIAMLELGVNVQDRKPRQVDRKLLEKTDTVICMGCGMDQACLTGFTINEDWNLKNPKGKPLDEIREIRDEIKHRVIKLLKELE